MQLHRLLLAFFLFCPALAQAADPAALDPAARKAWFMTQLAGLLPSGLADPREVGQRLALDLSGTALQRVAPGADCRNPYDARSRLQLALTPTPAWYAALPGGMQGETIPGFMINPPSVIGAPAIAYRRDDIQHCSGRDKPMAWRESELSFQNLPAFACVDADDIRAAFPRAAFTMATDGVSLWSAAQEGAGGEATRVTFSFRAGMRCALGARLQSSPLLGARFARAGNAFRRCRVASDRAFCAGRPGFGWGDGEVIDQMDDAATAACGTIASLYDRNLAEGPETAPVERISRATPCEGL
ncbi:hypothetical protein [Roseomonas sp. 18066]|uniref:hypothetical protein n=1 Tax=Roseomonas sp. 18066 TaxID=2681412 RepID=UPI0013595AFE|nr:hypothetical protein [Roseomonas sp. 18066]